MRNVLLKLVLLTLTIGLFSCSSVSNAINPFYERPSQIAIRGEANDHALNNSASGGQTARKALEAMSTYRRAQHPKPNHPVLQPAVIRLTWIPDHLNSYGDLVPAHYYYLRVLRDRFAVQDAFELESQLGSKKSSGAVPYVYGNGN